MTVVLRNYKLDGAVGHENKPCQAFTIDGKLVGSYISMAKAASELTGFPDRKSNIIRVIDKFRKNGQPKTIKSRFGKVYIRSLKDFVIKHNTDSHEPAMLPARGKNGHRWSPSHPPIHPNIKD